MLVNNSLYYAVLIATSVLLLIHIVKPLVERLMFRLRLESRFLDFLSILIVFESTGLHLDEVLNEASKNKIILPREYMVLARRYSVLSKFNPDPYTCLRLLAKTIDSPRIARFLEGYSEILISTGDTVNYVESYLNMEFNSLKTRLSNLVSLIDTVYESFMIIMLGFIVYFTMPLIEIPLIAISLILSMIAIVAVIIVFKLHDLTLYLYNNPLYTIISLTLISLAPVIMINNPSLIPLYIFVTILAGIVLFLLTRFYFTLEYKIHGLLEDLYSSIRMGLPIDYAIINTGQRYGFPIDKIVELLKMGYKPVEITGFFNLPPLPKRVFELVLAPIEYNRGVSKYFSYILGIVESVLNLRRFLSDRARIYYIYVFALLIVIVALARLFTNMVNTGLKLDRLYLIGVSYSSIYEALMIASMISRGYWFRNIVGLAFIVLTYVLIIVFI